MAKAITRLLRNPLHVAVSIMRPDAGFIGPDDSYIAAEYSGTIRKPGTKQHLAILGVLWRNCVTRSEAAGYPRVRMVTPAVPQKMERSDGSKRWVTAMMSIGFRDNTTERR